MNRVQVAVAMFLLPAIAALALIGGLNLMDDDTPNNNVSDENISDPPGNDTNTFEESGNSSITQDTIPNNSSEKFSQNRELNLLREQKIQPLTGEKPVDEALNSFMSNESVLTRDFIRADTSSVFIYEGSDSKVLVFLHSNGEESSYIESTLEGLENAEIVRGRDFVRHTDEDKSFYSLSWNLSSREVNGTAFRLNESMNVTVSQSIPSDMVWQLISGSREDMKAIELDTGRPLTITTE